MLIRRILMEKVQDEPTKKELITKLLDKSNNRCCICQTSFIHSHHIDLNPNNDTFDNLAPLCPNCHAQAHSKSNMYLNLTPDRIKSIRNTWYEYCEKRKEGFNFSGEAKLKIKIFVNSLPLSLQAKIGWAKMFSSLDENYKEMVRDEIIDRVFSTSNPNELKTRLEAVKTMYENALKYEEYKEKFIEVCNSFGFNFDGENIIS